MARLSNGFLGNASGKIGNVVFARWRNIFTARQYQPDIEDAKTPAQLKQRSRMVALLQFLKPLNKSFHQAFQCIPRQELNALGCGNQSQYEGCFARCMYALGRLVARCSFGSCRKDAFRSLQPVYQSDAADLYLRAKLPDS